MGSCQELSGKYKGKRWENNTEMDVSYKWCENVDLIYMV